MTALLARTASPCWGGEGFLNPNAKVNEAILYGRDPLAALTPAPEPSVRAREGTAPTPPAGGESAPTPDDGAALPR